MAWYKIDRIEDSKYNKSKIGYFLHNNKVNHIVISDYVLKYLDIYDIREGDLLFMIKSVRNNKLIWIAKMHKRGEQN